jgi:O-antigen biosynthesis protein WbqP
MLIRTLDILFSLSGIIMGLPVMLLIYVIGFFDSRSPIFFQQRVGRHQKPFILIKFRTMAINTESVGSHLVDTNVITKFGGFLRKTKLDELPQLFNVLLGHMSLVGPRPCLPNQIELISERKKRGVFYIRPGITGLAQINDVDMSTPRKLARYDQLMIDTMNISTYLKTIIATGLGRGHGDRVRSPPQNHLQATHVKETDNK